MKVPCVIANGFSGSVVHVVAVITTARVPTEFTSTRHHNVLPVAGRRYLCGSVGGGDERLTIGFFGVLRTGAVAGQSQFFVHW